MMLGMQFLQPRPCHMGINLGRRKIAVPQQHLHHTQVSAVIKQMGGEGVAQGMR